MANLVVSLSTKRRSVSRCPVQYRFVLTTYGNGGAGDGPYSGDFVYTFGDLHLYKNHLEQAHELPGYDPHPSIKAPIPV